jgi:hypothetical protein
MQEDKVKLPKFKFALTILFYFIITFLQNKILPYPNP